MDKVRKCSHRNSAASQGYSRSDFDHSPLLLFYEITRACSLRCRHCRAEAQPNRHPLELSAADARKLVDEACRFDKPPMLVITGGDPARRPDLIDIIRYATGRNIRTALTPAATRVISHEFIAQLKDAGLHRLAVSIDAAEAALHDGFRGVTGSFARTLDILADARDCRLPFQVNTTITRDNIRQIDAIYDLMQNVSPVLWSLFFLIPMGRASAGVERISAIDFEMIFAKLAQWSDQSPFAIKTTEAPHYRRFLQERARFTQVRSGVETDRQLVGTNDGRGVMFVSHIGEVFPSGFLPIQCGRFPRDSLVDVYQHSPLFKRLRDPDQLQGKCGSCDYREICGGSRARAFGVTGDPLAAEPDCMFISDSQGAV